MFDYFSKEWAASRDRLLSLGVPRCYYGRCLDPQESQSLAQHKEAMGDKRTDSEETLFLDSKSTLVLEDLDAIGYAPNNSKAGLKREEIRAALKELAIIHALSWAYQDGTKEDMASTYNFTENVEEFTNGLSVSYKYLVVNSVRHLVEYLILLYCFYRKTLKSRFRRYWIIFEIMFQMPRICCHD